MSSEETQGLRVDNSRLPIGIFDSGIGGLTVLKEILSVLPGELTIYLGDTARVPYGIRSAETVTRYSFESTKFLASKGIKMLVVACNTVSSVSLDAIKDSLSLPVIGVIDPGAKAAVKATRNGKIGVIGTDATIKSSAYAKAISALDESIEVTGLACPLFVPLVEEGWTEGSLKRGNRYARPRLYPLSAAQGCTYKSHGSPGHSRRLGSRNGTGSEEDPVRTLSFQHSGMRTAQVLCDRCA
jgi:glutamate racemase